MKNIILTYAIGLIVAVLLTILPVIIIGNYFIDRYVQKSKESKEEIRQIVREELIKQKEGK